MKNLNDLVKTITTMIKNFNDAYVFDEMTCRTDTYYGVNDTSTKPNFWFTDDGERVVINDAIEIKHNGRKYYIDVQCDACYIYTPNKEKRCFDFVSCISYHNYKNITSLQLAIATKILMN